MAHVFFKDSIIKCFCFFCLTGPSAFSFVRQLYPGRSHGWLRVELFSLILTFELARLALVHAHVTIIALAQRRCFERRSEKIMRYPSIYDVRFMAPWGRLLDSSMTRRSMGVQINSDFYLETFSYSMRIESWSHAFSFYDYSLFGCFMKGSRRCHYTILVGRLFFATDTWCFN